MDATTPEEAPLTTTLMPIYARFIFEEHQQALCFAKLIVEQDRVANENYAPERALCQATVRREIHPVFRDITFWQATLTARAAPSNGECAGWGH